MTNKELMVMAEDVIESGEIPDVVSKHLLLAIVIKSNQELTRINRLNHIQTKSVSRFSSLMTLITGN